MEKNSWIERWLEGLDEDRPKSVKGHLKALIAIFASLLVLVALSLRVRRDRIEGRRYCAEPLMKLDDAVVTSLLAHGEVRESEKM